MGVKLRRLFVLLVIGILFMESILPENIMAQDTVGGSTREITNNVLTEKNSTFEGADSGTGIPYWWYGSSATLTQSDDCWEGSKSMKVTPSASGSYVGGASNLTGVLLEGTTYEYTFYAKMASEESGQVALVLNYIYQDDYSDTQQVLAATDETSYTFSSGEWTKVTGTFKVQPAEGKEMKGIHLLFTAVDTTTPFLVDDLKVGILDDSQQNGGENLIYDPQFSDETSAWYAYANGAVFTRGTNGETDQVTYGTGYGSICGRTQNWECIGQDVKDRVKNNTDYRFSFYARLNNEYGEESRTVQLCTTKKDSNDSSDQYDKLTMSGGKATVSAHGWTKIEGTLSVVWTGELEKLTIKISEQGDAISEGVYGSYDVANVQMYEVETQKKAIQTELKNLKDQFLEDFSGMAGVAIPSSALSDEVRMSLVTKHFNSITAENEMKPESLLGSQPTIGADGYPILNFSVADTMMDYVKNYNSAHPDQLIKVRGHVLVWHSQTPEWFFHIDYDTSKDYVDKETMLGRMENYISQVMNHFDGENSPYKGMIYSWDVVNEAINDSDGGIRSTGSSWYQVFKDNSFITKAFVYANQYAPSNVKLFYNDYNETNPIKVQGICKLIGEIKATEGTRIDGMGMQAHYDMASPTVGQFKTAAVAYAQALGSGGEIQLTELDLKSSTDYDGTDLAAEYQKQAYRYKELYDAMLSLEQEQKADFGVITVWGTHDGASWLQTSNSVGGSSDGQRPQCPLLFDDDYQAKPAYWAFVDSSKLEPFIQKGIAVCTDSFNTGAVKQYSFITGNGEAVFTPIWNSKGLQVRVNVKDNTVETLDAVKIYIDDMDSRSDGSENIETYTIARDKAIETTEGYIAEFNISIADMAVMKKIGFDVSMTNGMVTGSWNDLSGNQENSSKYYAQMVMKPFMTIEKGTIIPDGTIDTIWSKASEVPFTIVTGVPTATATAKFLWDETYLYSLIKVKDGVLNKDSAQAHEQDSVEIFLDENNHKSDAYEADDKQYRINYENTASFNGTNCKAENLTSKTVKTEDGYYVEAAFKWTQIKPAELAQIGLEAQINDASALGNRAGVVSWYDENGTGWSSPSVFGTALLVNTPTSTNPGSSTPGSPSQSNPSPSKEPVPSKEPEEPTTFYAEFSVKTTKMQAGKTSTALAKDLQIASDDQIVEWSSSNPAIVAVDQKGKITAKKSGTVVITVKTKQGMTTSITIEVVKETVKTTKLTIQNGNSKEPINSGSTVTAKVKGVLNLNAVVAPITSSQKVTYSSSNDEIAKVTKDGKITAKRKGTVWITIKSGNKTVKIKLKIVK